jgi:hypothetical protein
MNMKILTASGAVLCALMMTACMADEPATSSQQSDSETAAPDATGKMVSIPPELQVRPDGTFDNNTFTAHPDACHVTLKFCADPNEGGFPSFCQNGGCTAARADSAAFSLCTSRCGNIDCDFQHQYPNSPSC